MRGEQACLAESLLDFAGISARRLNFSIWTVYPGEMEWNFYQYTCGSQKDNKIL